MLKIPFNIYEEMLEHLRQDYPNEGCGLLGGLAGTVTRHFPTTNVEPGDKYVRYLIDPKEQLAAEEALDEQDQELVAIYHSHTHTPAYPSPTDVRTAYYPDSYYVLVSLTDPANPVIRAYKINKPDPWGTTGEIKEEELVMGDF
ncbi:MAG: Mov34/MPN/PAD family protein [Chloroflexi bacterium]|jgi:proteasome lid subunit RPN8/RPN11|nr:Mov34/MPN/PAD family protein [Chloroflexota bacterium]